MAAARQTREPPGTPGPDATRERILDAAAAAWHERSFDGVGTAELCRRAGVHKGSFFHFFASKEDLLLAVLDRHGEQLRAALSQHGLPADVPPLLRIVRFFDAAMAGAKSELADHGVLRGCPIGNVVSELATRSEAVRVAAARAFDVLRDHFVSMLREAERAGDLEGGTDVERAADALLVLMQGAAVLGKAYGDVGRLERLGPMVWAATGATADARARLGG